MKRIHFLIALVIMFSQTYAQNIGIGTTAPHASALLDIQSTNKGLLIPRMTDGQMRSILSPAKSLLVFNISDSSIYLKRDTGWVKMSLGNADNFWNYKNGHIYNFNTGNVGIGVDTPVHAGLEVTRTVGAAAAMFGAGKFGVTIEADNPEIGFNYFYNGSPRTMKAGNAAVIGMYPTGFYRGTIYLGNFGDSISNTDFGTINGSDGSFRLSMLIATDGDVSMGRQPNGNLLIPSAALTVGRSNPATTPWGTAAFFGTDLASHFSYSNEEDTYIRGGKYKYSSLVGGSRPSNIYINDYSGLDTGTNTLTKGGNVLIAGGGGNVGIGTNSPVAHFHVADDLVLFTGDFSVTPISLPVTSPVRLMWIPQRAAFRAGYSDDTSWNGNKIGYNSVAFGYDCMASGDNSLASGSRSLASFPFGIAIGNNSKALNNFAMAIGSSSTASGYSSVAIGDHDSALNNFATSMGLRTNASGLYSTAMGDSTIASAASSTAIGRRTNASGVNSFAAGDFSLADGITSVAIGTNAKATGNYSFALGTNTFASLDNATAFGFSDTASGYFATAFGNSNKASGNSSVAMGSNSIASGDWSTAMCYNTKATREYAVAMGYNTTASGFASTSTGYFSIASGNNSTAMGYKASTGGRNYSFCISGNSSGGVPTNNADNQMMMDFPGGYYFWTGPIGQGVHLDPNGNGWLSNSDYRKKENFVPLDGEKVLNAFRNIHFSSWNYKGGSSARERHYGIMAQDFYSAFGRDPYGTIGNDTTVNPIDMIGVDMAAIQALEKRTRSITTLLEENKSLKHEIEDLKKQVEELIILVRKKE